MRRRRFLAGAGLAGLSTLAGCAVSGRERATPTPGEDVTGNASSRSGTPDVPGTPPAGEAASELPDGVYVQRYVERMAMQGTATAGPFAVALMYAAPHVFWTVSGTERQRVERTGDVHLMAVVWDAETRTVLPEAGVSVEILREGALVSQEVIYPMLSQRMGFHHGGNFGLEDDGEYTVRVSVGGLGIRRTGAFQGRFSEPVTAELPLTFTEAERSRVTARRLDAYGERGAVRPAEMDLPQAVAPAESAVPGRVLGTVTSDDARLLVTVLEAPPEGVTGDGPYLAVSARTPYNRLVLPAMAMDVSLAEEGGTSPTTFEGELVRTLDPDLGYHYGVTLEGVEVGSGAELTLRPTLPPQVARHEGYERAFLEMDAATLVVR